MRHSSSMKHPLSMTLSALLVALTYTSPLRAAQAQTDELPPPNRCASTSWRALKCAQRQPPCRPIKPEADRLKAGPHEFVVRLAGQQRRTSDVLSDGLTDRRRYTETQLALERTLRSGNKGRQDSIVGEAGVRLAQVRRADAIHETSRSLLRAWIDWLRERATVSLWQAQEKDQAELTRHAERRVKAGDAARTEWRLQEASAAQTHANLISAQAREAMAKAVLDTQYPGLTSAASTELAQPQQRDLRDYPADTGPVVTQWLTERSHEWRMARLHAELIGARAERISQDRSADPTVGIYAASERGGAERVMGISLSLPLAGEARSAAERQALAQRAEAEQQTDAIRQKVLTESSTTWLTVQSALTGLAKPGAGAPTP